MLPTQSDSTVLASVNEAPVRSASTSAARSGGRMSRKPVSAALNAPEAATSSVIVVPALPVMAESTMWAKVVAPQRIASSKVCT